MFRITEVVKQLLIINALFFVAKLAFDEGIFDIIDMDLLALFYPESENFRPYQIVTHFFMHGSVTHIFFNMFALAMFGSALEALWGPKRFLIFYIVCAMGGAIVHTLFNYYDFSMIRSGIDAFQAAPTYEHFVGLLEEYSVFRNYLTPQGQSYVNSLGDSLNNGESGAGASAVTALNDIYTMYVKNNAAVGASGAIYGLLLGFGMLFPNVELMLIFLPIPIKAKYFIPILMVVELFLGIGQFSWDNIAHFAHLGGALFGFLMVMFWKKTGVGLK